MKQISREPSAVDQTHKRKRRYFRSFVAAFLLRVYNNYYYPCPHIPQCLVDASSQADMQSVIVILKFHFSSICKSENENAK